MKTLTNNIIKKLHPVHNRHSWDFSITDVPCFYPEGENIETGITPYRGYREDVDLGAGDEFARKVVLNEDGSARGDRPGDARVFFDQQDLAVAGRPMAYVAEFRFQRQSETDHIAYSHLGL